MDWGVSPTWPMTGISASTMASTSFSRFFEAPSILTAAAPGFLEEAGGVADGLVGAEVEREVGHVADDQGPPDRPGDGLGVVDHLVHGHGHGVLVPENDHAQGVADQDEVDPGLVEDLGRRVIVGRQADDLRPDRLSGLKGRDGDLFARRVGHRPSFLPIPPRRGIEVKSFGRSTCSFFRNPCPRSSGGRSRGSSSSSPGSGRGGRGRPPRGRSRCRRP